MYKSRIVVALITVTSVLFFVSQFLDNEIFFKYFEFLIVPLFTLLYFVSVERKKIFFSLFLVCYAISDLLLMVRLNAPFFMFYYITNSLYILAYMFLILEICKSMSLIHLLKHYKLHMIVLVGLNIYVVYILETIVNPKIIDSKTYEIVYFLETLYNIIILVLLSVSLMNYFYKDNKKSLLLFIGSLCIVFAEVINIAYVYVAETKILKIISAFFYFSAFIFYYQQSRLENEKANRIITK